MAKGHRLNTSIVLAAVHGLRSFSGGFRGRTITLSSPSHSVLVPNRPSRFRGRKATMKKKKNKRLSLPIVWLLSDSELLDGDVKVCVLPLQIVHLAYMSTHDSGPEPFGMQSHFLDVIVCPSLQRRMFILFLFAGGQKPLATRTCIHV